MIDVQQKSCSVLLESNMKIRNVKLMLLIDECCISKILLRIFHVNIFFYMLQQKIKRLKQNNFKETFFTFCVY